MIQSTNLNCDIIIFVWYLWFCQEHLAKLTHIMMDMLRGQRCWLMASEVTELVSTGETWTNFNASCSGFIFTTSLPPTVLAGSLTSVRLLRRKTTESQAPGQCQVSSPSFVKVRHQSFFFLRDPVLVIENVNISGDSGTLEMKELLRVKRTFPRLKATTRVKLCCSHICEILLFELWSPL